MGQGHLPVADHQAAVDEGVLLIEVLDELAEGLAGLVGAVEDPLLHAQEVLDLIRVVQDVDHIDVLLAGEAEGLQGQEGPVEDLTGDVAHGIDRQVDVHVLDPGREQVVRGLEVYGGDHGHQVLDLFRVHGGVAEAEGTALADAEDVDGVDAVTLADEVDAVVEISIEIVIDGQGPVSVIRVAPVDEIDVLTGGQQALDG